MNRSAFKCPPSRMTEKEFVDLFGGVYEHSPWIAEHVWHTGLTNAHDNVTGLALALSQVVNQADRKTQLVLINAHPDLAGKAAQQGELTAASTSEQAGAGIDQCTEDEFKRFQSYNNSYKKKFDIPFVMAVKGSNRHAILAAFEKRMGNNSEDEIRCAIAEIHKIALFRLEDIANKQ